MYREPGARAATPPTRIVYRSKVTRPGSFFAALVLLAIVAGIVLSLHASHLVCERSVDDDVASGRCTIDAYGLIVSDRHQQTELARVSRMDVEIREGSKKSKTAYAELVLDDGARLDLSGGALFRGLDPGATTSARLDLDSFLAGRGPTRLDVWLRPPTLALVMMAIFGVILSALGSAILREQLEQLRAIVIVVDHDRRTVTLGGQTIAIADIEEIAIASGEALTWSSKKNERIPGHKIVVRGKDGRVLEATKRFRAGDIGPHHFAKRDLLRAIGPIKLRR